jgi:homoserine dehydrogenase
VRVEVADQPGVLALIALRLAAHGVSVARLVQQQSDGSATLHVITHEAPEGRLRDALDEIDSLDETRGTASALPVVSDRGVPGLGWA